MQDWEQCCQNVPCVPQHHMVQTFHRSKLLKYVLNVIQNWETDALQFLCDGAYFLLADMVEGDESSRLRKRPILTALWGFNYRMTDLDFNIITAFD